jgi:hypothetical protein
MGVGKLAGGILGKIGDVAANKVAGQVTTDELAPYAKLNIPGLTPMLENMKQYTDISDPENLNSLAGAVTSYDGALNGIKNEMIMKAGPTPIDLDRAISGARAVTDASGAKLPGLLTSTVRGLGGNLGNTADPNDVFDAIKTLRDAAVDANDPVLQRAYNTASRSLQSDLYNSGGANKLMANYTVTPEDETAIDRAVSKVTGSTVEQKAALKQYMMDNLNNAKSIPNVQAGEKDFVLASQVSDMLKNKAESSVDSLMPETDGGTTMGSHPAVGAAAALMHHPAVAAGAAGASLLGKLPPELVQNTTGALTRLTGKPVSGAIGTALADASTIDQGNNGGAGMASATGQPAGAGGAGGYDPNQLAEYLMQAIQVNPYMSGQLAPVLAQLQGPLRQSGAAQSALQGLEGVYGQSAGQPGILRALEGLIPGTAANQYNRQRGAVEAQLQAAGLPAALPGLMASPATASAAFQAPMGALGALAQPGSFQGQPSISMPGLLGSLPYGGYQ